MKNSLKQLQIFIQTGKILGTPLCKDCDEIEVEGDHEYFAGEGRVLSHNSGTAPNGGCVPVLKGWPDNEALPLRAYKMPDNSKNKQAALYRDHLNSGKPLTWDDVIYIEVEALKAGGIPAGTARKTVDAAIGSLISEGIVAPSRVPFTRGG